MVTFILYVGNKNLLRKNFFIANTMFLTPAKGNLYVGCWWTYSYYMRIYNTYLAFKGFIGIFITSSRAINRVYVVEGKGEVGGGGEGGVPSIWGNWRVIPMIGPLNRPLPPLFTHHLCISRVNKVIKFHLARNYCTLHSVRCKKDTIPDRVWIDYSPGLARMLFISIEYKIYIEHT